MNNIDVLMAVFNGEKYIREQIESIMHQTVCDFHLWIRDNCSEDKTVEIVREITKKYPNRMTLLTSPQNEGIIGNFSALMQHSQAKYIMFSDADDVWLPDKIAKTLNKMNQLENEKGLHYPFLVHTDLRVVDAKLETIHSSFWKYSYLNPKRRHSLSRQLVHNQTTGCTLMINRSLADIAKSIPDEAVMHDWWLGLCAAAFGKSTVVNESTMLYRQHGKNDTGAKKYSLMTYLKLHWNPLARKKRREIKVKTRQQAQFFLNRYDSKLTSEQKTVIKKFLEFDKANIFKKAYLMNKFGFYRVGLIRNIQLLCGAFLN